MRSLEAPILLHQSRYYFSPSVSKAHQVCFGHLLVLDLSNVCCLRYDDWWIELCACFLVILQRLVEDISITVRNPQSRSLV